MTKPREENSCFLTVVEAPGIEPGSENALLLHLRV